MNAQFAGERPDVTGDCSPPAVFIRSFRSIRAGLNPDSVVPYLQRRKGTPLA
jgi:hypothetical protein